MPPVPVHTWAGPLMLRVFGPVLEPCRVGRMATRFLAPPPVPVAATERNTEASGHAGILEAARATLMDLQVCRRGPSGACLGSVLLLGLHSLAAVSAGSGH